MKVWDPSTGENLLTLEAHTKPAHSVAFSPDRKRLASAGDDQAVRVWDAETGKQLLIMERHTGAVKCVAFSPDGKQLASASEDTTVTKRWKLELPDRDYVSPELKFRGAPRQLLEIHYLAETPAGIFLDAVNPTGQSEIEHPRCETS